MLDEKNYQTGEVEKYYHQEDEMYRQIAERGFSEYANSLPDLAKAFETRENCVCCIDEGTPEGGHVAGSGILMSEDELISYYEQTKSEVVTSHDNCGAAKIYDESQDMPSENPDEAGRLWAQELAKKLGIKHRHISADEMKRPKEGHFARTVYYDLTGHFNYSATEGLPAGFTISRKFITPKYALEELGVALSITFGDHGLGNKITAENPFYLVVVAENEEQLADAKQELDNLSHSHEDKIKVDGVVKPTATQLKE